MVFCARFHFSFERTSEFIELDCDNVLADADAAPFGNYFRWMNVNKIYLIAFVHHINFISERFCVRRTLLFFTYSFIFIFYYFMMLFHP